MIQVRRHPLISTTVAASGLAVGIAGFFSEDWIFLGTGIGFLLLGAMLMLNPVLEITPEEIIMKNFLGMIRAKWPHDGLENLSVYQNQLYIEHRGQRAVIDSIRTTFLHQADWKAMAEALDKARELAAKAKR